MLVISNVDCSRASRTANSSNVHCRKTNPHRNCQPSKAKFLSELQELLGCGPWLRAEEG